ncbi:MAG: thiamine-phosphate kinase [Luteimonas sp.]
MAEFELIARILERATTARDDVILGIGDDAALLQPRAGMQLVVTMDTLNAGVHFPHDTPVDAIGWKALAVNLSDLAAMGAMPAWCTLSLSLPQADAAWVDGFLDGFLALAARHDVALVGGDTTRGPLSICVSAHGFVERGTALRRSGARVGDDIWVTGTLGDAAAALAQWQSGAAIDAALRRRLDRPTPRHDVGRALRGIASACIDVSDGLLADLGHVCTAGGVGAEVEIAALPASAALRAAFAPPVLQQLQATGGDDYELCFSAPRAMREPLADVASITGTSLARIGRIVEGDRVIARDDSGAEWTSSRLGHDHFRVE